MDINELIAIVKKKLQNQIKIKNVFIEDKSFLHKNHKRENMLQKRARHRFGICTCHGCLQNASVARHFLQKGDCHSRISSRLSRKQLRNSNKCI